MATVRNFEVISNKFNVHIIWKVMMMMMMMAITFTT